MQRTVTCVALCVGFSLVAHAQGSGGTLKRITDSRSITLGYRTDSVPLFSFLGDDKQPTGYTIISANAW